MTLRLKRAVAVCALMLLAAAPWALADLVDGVVAAVGDEVILHSDLLSDVGPLLADLRAKTTSPQDFEREADKALREALDNAIERKLLAREAKTAGYSVTDDQIEHRLQELRKDYDSNEAFLQSLQEYGYTLSDYREQLREQATALSFGEMKRRTLRQEAVVSEAEMQQYYQDHQAEFAKEARVRVRRIFIPTTADAAERAKAKAQLEALKEEIALGADFAALAKQHSEGPDAEGGGLLGWVEKGDLVGPVEDAAFSLPVGGVSDVLETEFGVLLLKVEEKAEAGQAEYDEVRTEIEPELREQYAQERYKKWIEELRARSAVVVYL